MTSQSNDLHRDDVATERSERPRSEFQASIVSSQPRVSVICAAYNGVSLLPDTIASLKTQTLQEFEAVFVDDASTDGTRSMLESTADPRFVVVGNEVNSKLVATRNRAVSIARGRYVAVTDQDDVSLRDRLARQAAALDAEPQASAVYCRVSWIGEHGESLRGAPDWDYGGERARIALVFHNFIAHSTLMFRKALVSGPVYVPRFPLCEDYWLIVRLADQGKGILPISDRLVRYRKHSSNYSTLAERQMASLSRTLRSELLRRLGVVATDAEMELHDFFESGTTAPKPELHEECRKWLLHLEDANRRSGYVPASDFDAIAADKWLDLSHKFAPLGRSAWSTYARGPRRNLASRHWPSVAKLWLKCMRRPV